jgi:predicted metalloprotease
VSYGRVNTTSLRLGRTTRPPPRRLTPLLAALTLCSLLLAGTAQAATYPIRDRALTANKLYRSGDLRPSQCTERQVKPNDVPAAKRYLTTIVNCLNRSWAAHFARAGLPFAKARIGFITKPRRFCETAWIDASARYCDDERRFLVLLDRDLLSEPSDLFLFDVAAHEFGHHLQNLTGMGRAFDRHPYQGKSELNEQLRRYELQAECLAGVFIRSAWESLDRTTQDWETLLDIDRNSGDEQSEHRTHGKGRTIAAWLDKGFRSGSPAACNTWTVPSARVS